MISFIGKNTNFKAVFDCDKQSYSVYYKGKLLIENKYRFRDIKSYLD